MKKRVVSLLLALVMLTSLLPTTVWAEMAEAAAPDTEMQDIRQEQDDEAEQNEEVKKTDEAGQEDKAEQDEEVKKTDEAEQDDEAGQDDEAEQEDDPALAGQPMLSAVMPAAVTLKGSGTEADPYQIGSAEDFAAITWQNSSGYFKLTDNITVTKPCDATFKGTFDGDGHTVTLTLNVTSGNAGLFGETGGGAVIKNLTVDADVTSTAGSNYAATAGLVGKVSGSTTVENCGVTGTASNTSTSSSPVYVGGLIGYLTGNCTVTNSYSQATVSNTNSASSSSTGGFLGKTSNYCTLTVKNCYSSGDVTANKGYAGGFTGYVYCSSSYKHIYENCYAAGTVQVTGASSNACGFAYSYAYSGYTFTNCYYNNSANTSGCNRSDAGIAGKTAEELKGLAEKLGEAYQKDAASINGGYPILTWQYNDPTATPTVTVTVMPTDAKLIWDDMEQTGGANGVYTLTDQTQGQHTYTVSHEAGDYAAQTGTITVKSSDMTKTFTLALNRHKLTFNVQPENAELTVKSGTTELTAESENTYSVVNGTYTYTAELFGYKTAQGSVAVDRADKTHTVTMQAEPAVTVTFANADKGQLTVVTGERTMSPDKNGAYALPVGYRYDWTFKSANYAKQTGSIDLTGVTEDGTRTVTIPLAEKTAWGGADDIVAPTKVGDVYQIGSGGELAWFAQEVNAGRGAAYNAVLTKDIDLGDEPWTPIGKSTSYAYKGTFDGQKHTVSGLYISGSASQNCGLFGYVSGGTVKNLTVEGTVIGGECTAGIIGEQNGTACVENCVNRATVSGTNNVGGIAGKVNGSSEKYIRACANLGNISGGNSVGGIVGYAYYKVTVSHCYNRGAVTASVSKAGGIVGYMNDTGAKFSNCYTTGAVTAKSDYHPVVGKKSSGSISGCYYLDTLGADSNAAAKTSDELKALAPTLGEPFMTDPADVNDGYPIFAWQVPTYAVTFHTGAAGASVTVNGVSGQADADGKYTVKLPDGTYKYTVSAFGYQAAAGQVTVNGKAQSVTVTLTPVEKRTVRFNVTPTEAKAAVTVTWDGDGHTVAAQSDGSYLLPEGAYTYTVKAKGYAKVVEPLKVAKDETISVTLTPSTAWDGAEREQPDGSGTKAAPYQIGSGAELAWLANAVNDASSGTKFYVVLTDDIDLGNQPWTPIGRDFHEFSGAFDGNGHVVEGLKVSNVADAGLFGAAKGAAIKNLVVRGSVTGTDNAAGILAKAKNEACTIENCGNEAAVTVTKSGGGNAGGILGITFTDVQIARCYNRSAVTSTGSTYSSRAGGIVGYINGSNGEAKVNTCYNTGNITSDSYAAGVFAGYSLSLTVSSCYNTGKISGKNLSYTGAFTTGSSDTAENSFYLAGSIPTGAKTNAATAISDGAELLEQLEKLGAGNWKTVRGVNNGYPVLAWQTDETPAAAVTMAKNIRFAREEFDTDDGDVASLPTGLLLWNAESGKTYTVTLWQMVRSWMPLDADGLAEYDAIDGADTGFPSLEKLEYVNTTAVIGRMSEEQRTQLAKLDAAVQAAENDPEDVTGLGLYQAMERRAAFIVSLAGTEDLGVYESQLTFVEDISNVSAGKYDLSGRFAARGDGVYYASVAKEKDGQPVCCDIKTAERRIVGDQEPYNRMTAVTGLRWEGTTAKWNGRENFSGAYRIDLYTVTGEGTDAVYTHFKTFALSGNYTSANFANAFAAGKKYAFKIGRAHV